MTRCNGSEPRRHTDSAGVTADYVSIEEVRPGDEVVGGWLPWPIVRRVEVGPGAARMHFDHGPGGWQPRGMPVPIKPRTTALPGEERRG